MAEKDTQPKNPSSVYIKIVNALRSTIARRVGAFVLLIFAIFMMFILDKDNGIRNQYLPFLNAEWINDVLKFLNMARYNMNQTTWIIFDSIVALVFVLLVTGIVLSILDKAKKDKKNDNEKVDENAEKSKKTRRLIISLSIIGGYIVVMFVLLMLGLFDGFDSSTPDIFMSLLYSLLLCVFAFILLIVVGLILFFIIKFIVYLVRSIIRLFTRFTRDVEEGVKLEAPMDKKQKLSGKEIFPALTQIDIDYSMMEKPERTPVKINPEEFVLQFQSYCINNHKIYYELPLLRSFVAGLASSRLIILEGLSGTGKSMLPRMFSCFTGSNAFFAPVQATWRDKTDLLGFYSEFAKSFKTTDFLKDLYRASYYDNVNLMTLDEMNISRIEYYFADFLSILEYPPEEWTVKVIEPELDQDLPDKLVNGYVRVPENTWFIGTANTDDSTFTITDKVFDRAVVLDFGEMFRPMESDFCSDPLNITAEDLVEMFKEVQQNEKYTLGKEDLAKFFKICDFVKDAFDIRFGNRIMLQIQNFVPVYVALGGTREEALDFMFTRKILRKLSGMYDDFIKDELTSLQKLLNTLYGKGTFKESERFIAKTLKRLG